MLPHEDHRAILRSRYDARDPILIRRGAPLSSPRLFCRDVQPDGRIRLWGEVTRVGEDAPRILRVVTLADGETVHNAFFDRGFKRDEE